MEKAKKAVDTVPEKKRRGPKPKVVASWLRGRADNWRKILEMIWQRLWPALEQARTQADVVIALEQASPYQNEFVPHVAVIFSVLKDPRFPKTRRGRINFLADSAAGLGYVSPRRSRDICAAERMKEKRTHHIVRYEFYVECSCGYEGPSKNHACQKCGAKIEVGLFGAILQPNLM